MLKEEWERREQLEKLQQEQQELLESERLKRLEFERKQQENEDKLRGNLLRCKDIIDAVIFYHFTEATARLEQLESEKTSLDTELQTVREKVRRAEGAQILLEAQIVVTRPLRGGDRIRRTQSMIPTTKERNDDAEILRDRVISVQDNGSRN